MTDTADTPADPAKPLKEKHLGGATGLAWRVLKRLGLLAMLTVALLAIVFWYRSGSRVDRLGWRSEGGNTTEIVSFNHRVLMLHRRYPPGSIGGISADPMPIMYDSGPLPETIEDRWQDGIGKMIGIGYERQQLSDNDIAAIGHIIRVKWITVIVLAGVPLVVAKVLQLRRGRHAAAGVSRITQAGEGGYCTRCGRPAEACVCDEA